eukprot:CAMPEP_0171315170 /NCGR_PEP_ID=MMETSP0816-20121228/60878_1 /TAXON_ID=420281 /ORGANISM="Proboscia inermis, Strain CCAP1064/1" /LENGTH=67 /DNA_ID=CAMNT_0011805289 /DNA_START=135 /DNA_END=335 /DNA_ORIENTATION=+
MTTNCRSPPGPPRGVVPPPVAVRLGMVGNRVAGFPCHHFARSVSVRKAPDDWNVPYPSVATTLNSPS